MARPVVIDAGPLVARYTAGETIYELAAATGHSVNGVYRALRRGGIVSFRGNKTPPVLQGADSPRWKGGVSKGYQRRRSGDWPRQRALALARDGVCTECGGDRRLSVHHVESETDHSLENLRTLCTPCHTRLHRRLQKGGT